jgi:hypothetical protein
MVAKLRNELFKRKFLFHYYNCKNKTENYISFFCQTNNLFLRIFVPLFLVLFNLKALFFSFLSFSKIVLLSADSPLTQSNRQTDRQTDRKKKRHVTHNQKDKKNNSGLKVNRKENRNKK